MHHQRDTLDVCLPDAAPQPRLLIGMLTIRLSRNVSQIRSSRNSSATASSFASILPMVILKTLTSPDEFSARLRAV